jgi:hypothetical protein
LIAVVFFMASFGFTANAYNGLRIGVASNLVILALSFIVSEKKNRIIAAILCVAAYEIHKSTSLPICCMWFALFFIKDTKRVMAFWIVSIALSLVLGNFFIKVIMTLGLDPTLDSYLSGKPTTDAFSHVGFRWDFLLYSAMPIWMGYYVTIKRGIKDNLYNLILNTYVLANSAWVLVIRANFSNRFAGLSWFLFPLVIVYPLLKFNLFEKQGQRTAMILVLMYAFTYFMWLIGK